MKRGFLLIFLLLASGLLYAADETKVDPDKAITTSNPEIPVDELDLLLRPLTRAELETETQGWLKLLRDKVTEISEAEIASKHKRAFLKYADDTQAALDDVEQASQKVASNPEDEKAASALKEAKAALQALREEAVGTASNTEKDAAIRRIIRAAEKYALTVAENNSSKKDDGEQTTDSAKTRDASLDAESRKVEREKAAVSKKADERKQVREQLLDYITHLREEQTILSDRTNIVISAWELKGGDATEARQYIKAISGLQVDITDAEATWTAVSGWAMSEEGGQRWLKNISIFVITIIVFIFLSRLAERGTRKLFAKAVNTSQLLEDFTLVTVRRLVVAIGLLVALTTLEINVGPLLAVIGAAGFVVAFALQDSLGNFASGILILLFRPFDVGDLVEIGGIQGKVRSVNLLSVQINTPDNQMVIVPNNSVWGSSITNITGSATRRVDMIFGISYDDDISKAQRIMEEIVTGHELVLEEPEPVIQVHELADSSVNFVCRPWVKTENYWTVYWDLTRAVKQGFDKEGISIPYPQQDVYIHSAGAAAPVVASLSNDRPATPGKSASDVAPADADGDSDTDDN